MKKTVLILAVSLAISGCANSLNPQISGIKPTVNSAKAQASQLMDEQKQIAAASPVAYSDQSWIPLRKLDRPSRDASMEKTDAVQVVFNQRFNSLNDVAGSISSETGLNVFIASDVTSSQSGPAPLAGAGSASPPGMPTGMPGGMPAPFPVGTSPLGGPQSAISSGPIFASSPFTSGYTGSLTGFMNMVAAYYGIYWKSESNGLRFYLMDSKTFRIAALPGDTRLNSSVESASTSTGGSSNASTSSSSATQTGTSANSTGVGFAGLSVWTALEQGVKQMLGKNGRVVASPATGTITVTDTPTVLESVSEFIKGQNKSLNRQVSVNVRVLSVELNDGDDYGINWDVVSKNLDTVSGAYSVALKTAFPTASGAGNLIISAPPSSSSRWAGSSAMISALSTQGHVRELTSSTVVTLNNQPSPVNVGRKISYLASSSSTQTPNVGSTTSLTPGSVQTGFSMTLIPHIIDERELLLQYSLDLSSLLRLTTITSGTSSIQAPDVSTSNFIQRVRMQTGETLVVAGFDQDNLSAVSNGIGSAENPVLGSRNGTSKRTMLVVLIQPNVSP